MVLTILPPASVTTTSTATGGTLTTSTGTITYTGGTPVLAHKVKMWFVKDMQYYLVNSGTDGISLKITVQLTPNGDEIVVVPDTSLNPGDSFTFYYDKPAYYLNVYITPSSSTSEWKDEYILRW